MALSFFDTRQLSRGALEGEEQEKRVHSSHDAQSRPESKKGSNLRSDAPDLRRLHSDNSWEARSKGLNSPSTPRSPQKPSALASRPATSGTPRREHRTGLQASFPYRDETRPETAQSSRTDRSRKSFKDRALQKIRLVQSSRNGPKDDSGKPFISAQATSRSQGEGKDVKKHTRRRSWKEKLKEEGITTETRPQRSRANTTRDKASNILQQLTNLAASKAPPLPRPNPVSIVKPELNGRQAQFLAESLAHVTVGEWLFKDHNRPSLIPRNNPFRRQMGPPPRGSTGLPQRRWFRISPYDRKVMWSSRWDASSLDQLKTNRQVPVNLVFETSANALFEDCLPTNLVPFKRAIVIVAPQLVVKLTAPDEERHRMWLTALRYIADSTVKLDEEQWAAELRARFEVLSIGDLSFPDINPQAAGAIVDLQGTQTKHDSSNIFEEKPLPPSPPRSTLSHSTKASAITPPAVPRWFRHSKKRSEGVSTTADTSSGFHLPSRGSDNEPMPTLEIPKTGAGQTSFDLDEGERGRDREGRRSESVPGRSKEGESATDDDGTETERGRHSQRDSRRLTSDEFGLDQIEMLVDRLGRI